MVILGTRQTIFALVATLVAASFAAAQESEGEQPIVLEPTSDPPVAMSLELPEFTLVDHEGRRLTKQDLLGTPWVASFIFTRCAGACPNLIRQVHELNQRVADVDVRFVTITVDPEYDTVERLRATYADIYEADPDRWAFATGELDEIYKLIRAGFRVTAQEITGDERRPGYEFAHSLSLIHVNAEGRIIGRYASDSETELLNLGRVLQGRIETPIENLPIPPITTEPPEPAAPTPSPSVPADSPPDFGGYLSPLPPWAERLPATNAMLNGLATLLLLVGFSAIKAGHTELHKKTMLMAFSVSVAFLACYLTYHFALQHYTGEHGRKFAGSGTLATVYYTILISHVILAAAVPVLAIITIFHGLKQNWPKHRRIAKWTFPIWLYVSVTGVIIYWMLYHVGPSSA